MPPRKPPPAPGPRRAGAPLRAVPRSVSPTSIEPLTEREAATLLDAFEKEHTLQDFAEHTLRDALAGGELTGPQIDASFDRFLARNFERDPRTGVLRLPAHPHTIGSALIAYCERRDVDIEDVADDLRVPLEAIEALERADEPFPHRDISGAARRLSEKIAGVVPDQIEMVLQRIDATLGLGSAAAGTPMSEAARVPPGKPGKK